jgi:hypothetical protein
VDVLIESTKYFEQDLDQLSQDTRKAVIQTINNFANLFPENDSSAYKKLHQPSVSLDLNGYDSSLYVLRAVEQLRIILTVDEDPLFDQVILNLFRVVDREDVETSYQDIAKALYQEISHRYREPAQTS